MGVSYIERQYMKDELDRNDKMLSNLNSNLLNCNAELIAVKLKVAALQLQMTTMQAIYKDVMELRKIILVLNPRLCTESERKMRLK